MTSLLHGLVADGAALGWVDPLSRDEIAGLLAEVAADAARGDVCLVTARVGDVAVGAARYDLLLHALDLRTDQPVTRASSTP